MKKNCKSTKCPKNHVPKTMCNFGAGCVRFGCHFEHPKNRRAECKTGSGCRDFACAALHPTTRPAKCTSDCPFPACPKVHPDDWDPNACEGSTAAANTTATNSTNSTNSTTNSTTKSTAKSTTNGTTNSTTNNTTNTTSNTTDVQVESKSPARPTSALLSHDRTDLLTEFRSKKLKTATARDAERRKVSLPILKERERILERLAREKVMVITAETGSGKTTQMPQYFADDRGRVGLKQIVCTQPRAFAAQSIATRVAEEFDGTAVGANVGYAVGGSGTPGRKIMFVTDAELIKMARNDATLSHISTLMIDEAHERSLYTDIVLGIAKTVQAKRPNDFHVVVASATIDPRPFLDFFHDSGPGAPDALKCEGRIYPVDLEVRAPAPEQVFATFENELRRPAAPLRPTAARRASSRHHLQ
jgi:HrpA-like RNA helicase